VPAAGAVHDGTVASSLVDAPLALVGDGIAVPCADGADRRYVDLDSAASTPALACVAAAVEAVMPFYSSVHRGAGYKSQVATAALEGAREAVLEFVGARDTDVAVFVRNATEAINVLSTALPPGSRVLSSPVEHHANMLPWRRHAVETLPFTSSPEELLAATHAALAAGRGAIALLAVTGASNVTGEVWPVRELAGLAHEFGAAILVDGAQLVPHRATSMRELGIDYLAFSGHKLYAPYGAGALVGARDLLADAEPALRGGGAVEFVTLDDVVWKGLPERHEAGSPNSVGAIALGAACDALAGAGMDRVQCHERELAAALWEGLDAIDGIERLALWPDDACDRVGVAAFTCDGYDHRLLATVLSAEHAIGVRDGRFCAHPLVSHLLGIDEPLARAIRAEVVRGDRPRMPGCVRASIGVGTTREDIDELLEALESVLRAGPRLEYRYDPARDEYAAAGSAPARMPALPVRLAGLPA
jgi:selenocysteine lyase/cysteine desulfurase